MSAEKMDRLSRPITKEGLDVVFKVAVHVCPGEMGPAPRNVHAIDDAMSLMSDDERDLLVYFCAIYSVGYATEKDTTKTTRAKQ